MALNAKAFGGAIFSREKIHRGSQILLLIQYCELDTGVFGFVLDEEFACESPSGRILSVCDLEHKSEFYMRCRKCPPCMKFRVREWVAKSMRRYFWKYNFRWVYRDDRGSMEKVYMWTLGTNFKEGWHYATSMYDLTPRWHARTRMKRAFTLFRKILNSRTKRLSCGDPVIYFRPLVYVFEVGKHGYEHVHMVTLGWMDHKEVRKIWSRCIGVVNPNVRYSPPPIKKCCKKKTCHGKHDKYLEPHFAILYLSKYIAKDMRNYYWMGEMRGNIPEYEKMHKCYHKVWDEICGEWIYRFEILTYQKWVDDYFSIQLPLSRGGNIYKVDPSITD